MFVRVKAHTSVPECNNFRSMSFALFYVQDDGFCCDVTLDSMNAKSNWCAYIAVLWIVTKRSVFTEDVTGSCTCTCTYS